MNLFTGTIEGDKIRLPFADLPLGDGHRRALEEAGARGDVVVGLRPEHFEDATLVGGEEGHGVTFEAPVEVTESMGSEVYAYFGHEGGKVASEELQELADDAGAGDLPSTGGAQAIARLNADTEICPGQTAKLWVDASRMHLFDPHDGRALRVGGDGGHGRLRRGGDGHRDEQPTEALPAAADPGTAAEHGVATD
jgi:multiple sugar transport system ATP-binding protein